MLAVGAVLLIRMAPQDSADDMRLARLRSERFVTATSGAALPGTPDLARLDARLAEGGFRRGAPVFIRIFKLEMELELWLKRGERFELFATYPICTFSGRLGPKLKEGDRQSPEGFYVVDRAALNPASRWHRSFNLGFPNAYDRAHGRTGSFLMVHGGCASIGCYAMTDGVIDEIWRLVTAALDGGQRRYHVHAYPFRLTDDALAARAEATAAPLWRVLKAGSDAFEATRMPPRVAVCDRSYRVSAEAAGNRNGDTPLVDACL